ncbi:hypothetical protein SteCoe_11819 [Stentor coeruleus]|uniref:Uncharacterized protein n=1 Tax=Stentor coeruleus TaxID=5963 RepID=A0A1R2CC88_9CILI|nr:hypothetical protein SteCoe_11819 [Stentor coeruleus]
MKKSQASTSDSKEIIIDFLYDLPTNQTPENLGRMSNSLTTLKHEIQHLQDILIIQNSEIAKIEKKIHESKQENSIIKTKINKAKLHSKQQSKASLDYNFEESFNRKEKLNKNCQFYDEIKTHKPKQLSTTSVENEKRIDKLYRIMKKNNEEYTLLEKRLDVAEGLLGLKLR